MYRSLASFVKHCPSRFISPRSSRLPCLASPFTSSFSSTSTSSPTTSSSSSSSSSSSAPSSAASSSSSSSFGTLSSAPHTIPNKSSFVFTVQNKPGALQLALQYFWKHGVNITHLSSRPNPKSPNFDFYVCVEGTPESQGVANLFADMQSSSICTDFKRLSSKKVPWFPLRVQDMDAFANETLDAGIDLQSDHPGFMDPEYRARRNELAQIAKSYRFGADIPYIKYTPEEIATWSVVYNRLYPLVLQYGCKEHRIALEEMHTHCGYRHDNIPQVADISKFLKAKTGFQLRPVAGLLSARNFLYGLAFRVFFSTQYIRHHSKPLYTPEPDLVHELMGHAPLFADPAFADFSQEIGLASIGATEEQITHLARCYWFSVEFGMCNENGKRKAYGAGLLSSFGELEYAMSDQPVIRPWDPFSAAQQEYPITTYQPIYYLAQDFEDAKTKMKEFSMSLSRPFHVRYDSATESLEVDNDVSMMAPPQPTK